LQIEKTKTELAKPKQFITGFKLKKAEVIDVCFQI